MIHQTLAPFTIQVASDGHHVGTVELSPRQSWRLAQFAAANRKTFAEMISVAVSSLTEEIGPYFTVPDDVERANAEELEIQRNLKNN